MVRINKYDDSVCEKVEFSGKIFMYASRSWNVLFPIVDIIRILKANTIIAHVVGKGQNIIRMYGSQYNHRMLSYELKNKKDFFENLRTIRTIFIFSDESDTTSTNLINFAKTNKINVVCYSNLDTIYHFYNYSESKAEVDKFSFKTPELVIEKMYYYFDLEHFKKYTELFDDFELIELPTENKKSVLDECIEKIKEVQVSEEKKKVYTKLFDPHLNKLKYMEYQRSQKNMIFPDNVENIIKKQQDSQKSLLSKFFKKK